MNTQIINFSLPQPLLQLVDRQAEEEARTRSGLIQEAIRLYLRRSLFWREIFSYGKKQASKTGVKAEGLEKIIDDYRG
ncbi:MAG: ribbon-helix-helix domain-containing protein [bacterium]|nr:ribbon-helix-helix domain-containing protein [bacterium]